MKKYYLLFALLAVVLGSCTRIAALQNSRDYEYKYEVAKSYLMEG